MAFNALTVAETDAESPLDSPLFTKIKDNFNDLDAARVTNGDAHDHINGDGGGLAGGSLVNTAVGNFVETPRASSGSTSALVYTATGAALTVVRAGAYRVKWSHNTNDATNNGWCYTKVYKNGVAVGVAKSMQGTTPIEVSDDISGLVIGDILQIYAYRTGASTLSTVSDMRLCVSQATSILSGEA